MCTFRDLSRRTNMWPMREQDGSYEMIERPIFLRKNGCWISYLNVKIENMETIDHRKSIYGSLVSDFLVNGN